MEREAKLRRLNQLRQSLPHVTANAFAALVQELKQEGLPELCAPKHFKEAEEMDFRKPTRHGPVLQNWICMSKEGKPVRIPAADPLALLDVAFARKGAYEAMLRHAQSKHPCCPESPWGLILYSDEITPGNVLSHDNRRRFWAFYFSIKQFGAANLQQEGAWLCAAVVRSSVVHELEGGVSQLAAAFLRSIFKRHDGCVREGGALFRDSASSPFRLFFELAFWLQDGGAHKHVFSVKGDAGSRLCLLCKNLIAKASVSMTEGNEELFTCEMMKESQLLFASNEEIAASIQRMKRKAMELSQGDFARWQQAAGMNYEPLGLLFDDDFKDIIKPANHFVHDWVHCLLVHGVFQSLMSWLLQSAAAVGLHLHEALYQFSAEWHLPKAYTRDVKALWNPKRVKASKAAATFKCGASDAMAAYPIIAFFLETMPAGHGLAAQVAAFCALADLLDLIASTAMYSVQPQTLREAVEAFYTKVNEAGWAKKAHSKFHWLVHFPQHLEKHRMLPGCLVHERKHRVAKRFADDVRNTTSYEQSLLRQMLAHDVAALEDADWVCGGAPLLLRPRMPTKKEARIFQVWFPRQDVLVALAANMRPGILSRGDYAVLKHKSPMELVQLWLFLEVAGHALALVSQCSRRASQSSESCAVWQNENTPVLLPLLRIEQSLTWRERDGLVQTLLPLSCKQ